MPARDRTASSAVTETTLEPVSDLAFARTTLEAYLPRDDEQRALQAQLLDWIEAHPVDAHRRECLAGHLTAGALLVDEARERVLMNHHEKLDLWLHFGGHCDGDANLRGVAWRETVEESGIEPAWLSPSPIDLDVHRIPPRPGEPEHLHLDVRYLARAPEGAVERCSAESRELRWLTPVEARGLDLDASVTRLIDLAFLR